MKRLKGYRLFLKDEAKVLKDEAKVEDQKCNQTFQIIL